MVRSDVITLSLSKESKSLLEAMRDDGKIQELLHGYRIGLAFAIKQGLGPVQERGDTFVNIGTFDPDGSIRDVILVLRPDAQGSPYTYIGRLAEAGLQKISGIYNTGQMQYGDLFD